MIYNVVYKMELDKRLRKANSLLGANKKPNAYAYIMHSAGDCSKESIL